MVEHHQAERFMVHPAVEEEDHPRIILTTIVVLLEDGKEEEEWEWECLLI